MRLLFFLIPILLLGACAQSISESEREALLLKYAEEVTDTYERLEWATVYEEYPSEFKASCSVDEFSRFLSLLWEREGLPTENFNYAVESVTIEGDFGWAQTYIASPEGRSAPDLDEDVQEEPAEFYWTGEEWQLIVRLDSAGIDIETTCDSDTLPHDK